MLSQVLHTFSWYLRQTFPRKKIQVEITCCTVWDVDCQVSYRYKFDTHFVNYLLTQIRCSLSLIVFNVQVVDFHLTKFGMQFVSLTKFRI